MSAFTLGSIDPLLVERFSGFDLPRTAQVVGLLSDGGAGPDDVLQSSGTRSRQAQITGTLVAALDCDALRAYDLTKEEVVLRDGRGDLTIVRILELAIEDMTDWWTFSATLLATSATGPAVGSGS